MNQNALEEDEDAPYEREEPHLSLPCGLDTDEGGGMVWYTPTKTMNRCVDLSNLLN